MDEMNNKKLYIWHLASFLHSHGMSMSGDELATHLNRNEVLTSYAEEYKGGRGIYKLIQATWNWVHDDLALPEEANHIAKAFVDSKGNYAYESKQAQTPTIPSL